MRRIAGHHIAIRFAGPKVRGNDTNALTQRLWRHRFEGINER